MNYHYLAGKPDWKQFALDAIAECERLQVRYYIKKDLAAYIGKDKGFWGGGM